MAYICHVIILLLMRRITLFILLLSISLCFSYFYRPFIYSNGYFDMYIADTFPNFFAVPVIISFMHAFFKNAIKGKRTVLHAFLGVILYELLQIFTGGFDFKDILSTIIGTSVLLLFWNKIFLLQKN